ncbi:OB-fold domain-containing protein [Frankia sp. CNm7]|uniref:OB-fold domain-containing protein n=1 Tax=Frankia nepalensis TaxID=1836974 RepID=A0A937RTZ8_9ACTN|nr:OB-fold domain-containing protein [Frankia nepalensis]MBL7500989.1 OB-fold domain-containing protein [Frankia nepalensis]MBL7512465.1 OB-fold domain-containing protein [Frankia nepalensis]MBL7521531.1 OB-fold domain-containing protein [Frankia nepalensis]MBL7632768.1 OB-fold domain-containing protein [Frankia nepalensis]
MTTASTVSPWDDAIFWEGVDGGRLLLARCARCSRIQHPPSPMCPSCGSVSWDVQESSGKGRLHSWIVSHHPSRPDAEPRVVVLVDLDDGVRFVSNLHNVQLDEIQVDMPVEVTFQLVGDTVLPLFTRPGGGT